MKSTENLKAAFAGESQANRKYTAFAAKAEADGFPGVAKLFRAAAAAETVHALSHFRVLGGVKGTVENLQAAVEGESYHVIKATVKSAEVYNALNPGEYFYDGPATRGTPIYVAEAD